MRFRILSATKATPTFVRGDMIRTVSWHHATAHSASRPVMLNYPLFGYGEVIDVFIGTPPDNIARASLTDWQGLIRSAYLGKQLDAVKMGTQTFSRYRVARRSEDGDLNGSLCMHIIPSTATLQIWLREPVEDIAIFQDGYELSMPA